MKTVGIIASCDTKIREVRFMKEYLAKIGCQTCVIDMMIGPGKSDEADISREEVFATIGLRWEEIFSRPKGELIGLMTDAMKATVAYLYDTGRIHGVLSAGGLQNTIVATAAMRVLPVGVPKVMATTVASGKKCFEDVVGTKDVITLPSICDFTGINSVTETILANACAAMAGMLQYAGEKLRPSRKKTVGVSLMGVTNEGCCAAIEELEEHGFEAIGFHATGVGGTIMEQLAADKVLDGILDITTHEITAEYFGCGFSFGTKNRIIEPVRSGIPMVVSVGGLDFIDCAKDSFPPRMEERVYNMHNATVAHIKILPEEATRIGKIFAERLNQAVRPITLVLPTEGMRKDARPGESLYAKTVDETLLAAVLNNIEGHVRVVEISGNVNDRDWGKAVARMMVKELEDL